MVSSSGSYDTEMVKTDCELNMRIGRTRHYI